MNLTGGSLIGLDVVSGEGSAFHGLNPRTGERLYPAYKGVSQADLDAACRIAAEAFDAYREMPPSRRARFLETVGDRLMDLGTTLVERCASETGLPASRIEGERSRTVAQLKMFASVVREGDYLDVRIDRELSDRQPVRRPDLRLRNVPVGPVAVFGASNFPLAFSVAGGDTAAALAAGCPVVCKAHPAHPGTSELVGKAVQNAVRDCAMPAGTFSLLFDAGFDIGSRLVQDPRIKAIGFTGSRKGGMALRNLAMARAVPIPVYAEMSSVNPVLLFPGALHGRADDIAKAFVASMCLGSGQFCTNPGIVLAVDSPKLDRFIAGVREILTSVPAGTMLTPAIHEAYERSLTAMKQHAAVSCLATGKAATGPNEAQAHLFSVSDEAFLAHEELAEEMFGPASVVVRCKDMVAIRRILQRLEGQLTASLHVDEADLEQARSFIPLLEQQVGRILFNGFGTGVEVSHAMVHGGPFPSTSDGRSTSVGSLSIDRFLRPVSYQDVPDALLPEALRQDNPLKLARRIDGLLAL
ncbi:aldehyde dehydrogenase (NADP(+)) [Paraburkholderia sp. BCC1885]|uniref:aldehyde dehydrogenase (NADP(+)) n=1 Tax=Paraburkholderia sp. BCC1885 TaxID=2562669 RepID=UPI00118341C0|nr:aldehyde dehydrogenase (NADP(+)) [Paraburkholderia sp. BCC1885]